MPGRNQPPTVEVWGRLILAFTKCLYAEEITPTLEKNGMLDLDPDKWYPLTQWLNVIDDVKRNGDAMFNFVSVGMRFAEMTTFPPQIIEIPFETLMTTVIPQGNNSGYRNGYDGYCNAEKIGANHILYHLNSPMPDDLNYGIFYGYIRRLIPAGSTFTLAYDDQATRLDQGGPETLLHLIWQTNPTG